MKNKEIEEILNYMKQYVENKYEHDSEPMLNYKDLQIVLSHIEQLEKENQLLKKQKADVVEYIKSFYESPEYIDAYDITYWTDEVLRILGEIDEL